MNKHLKVICNYVLHENFSSLIDIGTDHGILPLELVKNNYSGKILATDIRKNIVEDLKIKTFIYKNIKCSLNDGLKNIKKNFAAIIISGLGERVILKILKEKHLKPKEYILQTNKNPANIRLWIQKKNLFIKKEIIIHDKKHYYHTLFISQNNGIKIKNENEITFGPYLLKEKTTTFIAFWKKEQQHLINIKKKLQNKDVKKEAILLKKIAKIKKILNENI